MLYVGWTIRVIAFISLFCYIVAILIIYPRRPTQPLPHYTKLLDFKGFKDPCYVFLALGCWFAVFSIWNPFFYVGLAARVANPGSPLNDYYLAILCASSIVGRVSPGLFASRVGPCVVIYVSSQSKPISNAELTGSTSCGFRPSFPAFLYSHCGTLRSQKRTLSLS